MKNILLQLLVLFLITSNSLNAQVGINTVTPKATLDITKSTFLNSDGVLVPRVTAKDLIARHDANLYGIDQNSIVVYVTDITDASINENTDKITDIGFYYYNSSKEKWTPIIYSNTGIWNKIGTTESSLKNTDNSYINAKAVIGGDTITSINQGNHNAQLTILGEDIAVRGVTVGTGNGGYSTNSVLGSNALSNNTTGTYHVAIGYGALQNATTSIGNVAIGAGSSTNTNVNNGTSIGCMSNAAADYGTAIGANSTIDEASNSSTSIGYYSTIYKKSPSSIAIGQGAKIEENVSSGIAIGNSASVIKNSSLGIAIGNNSISQAENAIAIGNGANNNQKDAAFLKSTKTIIGNKLGTSGVTLEVIGQRGVDSIPDGILIPQVTLKELNAKEGMYAEPQFGALVFVNYVGDSIPIGKTEDVTSYGFYYYDYWNGRGNRWTRLSDIQRRQSIVDVGPDKYYKTLQTAYNEESKKLYNHNEAPIEFLCSGEVGGLDTDGSIPYIKITSDGSMTCSNKGFSFNKTIVNIQGDVDLKNNSITAYGSDIIILENANLKADELSIDNSSLKAFFGGNTLTFGAITCFNGFIDIEGSTKDTDLILKGKTGVEYLVSSTNRSYILFAKNLNITSNATTTQNTGFIISKSSTIYCNAVQNINFNGTYNTNKLSYDIYVSTSGNMIFEECPNIGGSSKPNFIAAASHKSNIIAYQTIMDKTSSSNGISLFSGSSFYIIGDRSSITLSGSNTSGSVGLNSSASNIAVSNITTSTPMVTLKNFEIGIKATEGGVVNAMKRINRDVNITQANIPTTIGTSSLTGAIIYDSDVE